MDDHRPQLRHREAALADDLLTGQELADALGVKRSRVRQLMITGALPSIKIGRSCYVTRRDVEIWKKFGRHKVGRPKGAIQFRLDALGHKHRIKYPPKTDWAARRRRTRELRREWERMYAAQLDDGESAA